MELKPGYKQTEVGVIPEDWDIVTATQACDLVVDCKNRTPPIVTDSDYAVVRTSNVRNGQFILEDLRFTDEVSYSEWTARAVPQFGDIMITREAPLGEVCAVPEGRKVCLGQRMMLYRPSPNKTDSLYLLYSLMSTPVKTNLLRKVGGSTVGHAKVDDIRFLQLPRPSFPEQEAIATALSDIDNLLEVLDRLIAKKQNLKQAAMQELLTGKKRLPGFGEGKGYKETEMGLIPEDWNICNLQKVCSAIVDGTHYTPKYVSDGVPFYSVENVTANDFRNTKFISEQEHINLIKRCKPEKGDILLTRIGSLGVTKLIDWDVNASIYVSLALLKLNKSAVPAYIYVYSKSQQFVEDVEKRSLVNATPKKINMEDIGKVPVLIPQTEQEQKAIANILSDMDTEITALKERRDKTLNIKQAMMQELLTGKTRLIAPGVTN